MIINIDDIFDKFTDDEYWEPIEFINHRREMLRFEKVAIVEYEGERYAYLYEIDDDDRHITSFPAVVHFGEEDGDRFVDFVTDKNLIEDVAYEVLTLRRVEDPDEVELMYENANFEEYDEDAEFDEDFDEDDFDEEEEDYDEDEDY